MKTTRQRGATKHYPPQILKSTMIKKITRLIFSIISYAIIAAVVLPIVAGLLLQIGLIQNYAVGRLTTWLTETAGTKIDIERVDIGFFNRAVFEGLYVQDPITPQDTLLYVDRLSVVINGIDFLTGEIVLGAVSLSDGMVHMAKDSSGVTNIGMVIEHFKPEVPWTGNVDITARELNLINLNFTNRAFKPQSREHGVNFQDLDLRNLHFQARDIEVHNDSIRCDIEHLTFREKSGFYLQHLSINQTEVSGSGVKLDELRIETSLSMLQFEHLNLTYDDWGAYRNFVNKVTIDAQIKPSSLTYRTIASFTKRHTEIKTALEFKGATVQGPASALKGRLWGANIGETLFDAEFDISGLPDIKKTRFKLQLPKLKTDAAQIQSLYAEISNGGNLSKINDILERAGEMDFTGSFDGLLHDFTAEGNLNTDIGTIDGSLQFMPSSQKGAIRFLGKVSMEDFRLGELTGMQNIGDVSLVAEVDAVAKAEELELTTDAVIKKLDFKGYKYNDIRMNGRFAGRTFEGKVSSNDPNLNFETNGRFDLSGEMPAYDFEMNLKQANLYQLNLNRRDSVSKLAMRFRAHATGMTIDNINGTATIDSLSYVNHIDTVEAGVIRFEAQNRELSKRMTISSDFADVELRGNNSYRNILYFFRESLKHYLPSMDTVSSSLSSEINSGGQRRQITETETQSPKPEDGYYLLKVDVKEANNVAAIFVPGLEISQGSSLAFLFNPHHDQFSLSIKSDYIIQRNLYVGNLMVESRNQTDSVSIYASAEQFGVGNIDLPNLSVIGVIKDNRMELATRFNNPESGSNALVSTITTLGRSSRGIPQLDVTLKSTTFSVAGQKWYITPSRVVLDSLGVEFHEFMLRGDGQELLIDGRATASEQDTLHVKLRNINISPLTQFVSRQGYSVAGKMDGDMTLVAPMGELQFGADIKLDSLNVSGNQLGKIEFKSEWDRARKWVRFAILTPDGVRPVGGVYDSKTRSYRVDIDMPEVNLALLEPLTRGIMTDITGDAEAKLVLTGGPDGGPILNGTVDIKTFETTVDYTKTRYRLSGPVTVTDNRFELPSVPIFDQDGGGGRISAWFDSEYFRKIRFDVRADFRDMLCMNTTLQDNPIFYGKIYGTGAFSIEGDWLKTMMTVRAETAKSSTFVMPLSEVSTISEADFITFKQADSSKTESRLEAFKRKMKLQIQTRRQSIKSELNIDLNLSVLSNTEAQIVMNPRLGDAIKGRGNGNFRMNIVPAREIFTMDGQYDISQGTYLFTLYGVLVNKHFIIQPGSTIQWAGDPADPLVDINAVYKVRTSLNPLLGSESMNRSTSNVNVDCGIHLSEHLFNPTIQLSITAPAADPETKNLLRNILNTEEATTMQFAYLMLSNSFMPDNPESSIGMMSGSLAGVAGMEFLSNQISNLISGTNYNIRFGYRPPSDLTSQEVTFDVGADIIENKLSVEVGGNYDVGSQGVQTITDNPLSVDGYVTWVLNRSGSLKVKGFTRTIDRFDESQGLQDNGIGVYYRQEFQNKEDIKQKYRKWREDIKRNNEARKKRRQEKEMARKSESKKRF